MRFLARLPWWAWAVLLVASLLVVQEVRVRRAVAERNALHEQQFRAVLGAIETKRQEKEREIGALKGERTRLKADVAAHRARADELARQTGASRVAVERVTEAGTRLVVSGSLAEVIAAGEALGLKPLAAPRPR